MHHHLPLIPAKLPNQREVEVGAADQVPVVDPGRTPDLIQQRRHLQHLLGGGEPLGPPITALALQGDLDVLDPPVEVGEDGVLGELEEGLVRGGEGAAAPELERLPGGRVGEEAVDVAVDGRDQGADGVEVEPLGEAERGRGRGGSHGSESERGWNGGRRMRQRGSERVEGMERSLVTACRQKAKRDGGPRTRYGSPQHDNVTAAAAAAAVSGRHPPLPKDKMPASVILSATRKQLRVSYHNHHPVPKSTLHHVSKFLGSQV